MRKGGIDFHSDGERKKVVVVIIGDTNGILMIIRSSTEITLLFISAIYIILNKMTRSRHGLYRGSIGI